MVRITLDKPYIPIPVPVTVKYGLLYNWYAANDVRNIAANGWGVGSQTAYTQLKTFLTDNGYGYGGSGDDVGKSVASILYWLSSANIGAVGNLPENNNSAGFNLPPSGIRQNNGLFVNLNGNLYGWQSTEYSSTKAYYHVLSTSQSWYNIGFNGYKTEGQAVRLIKQSTTLTHGQTGTYTGNDGKVYRTICIGTQEWLADNLCETKYRNGDTIPEVTNNAAWAALTTGALCAYNNDWSNVLI